MHIQNKALLRSTVFLGGKWIAADSGASITVRDPATGAQLAEVPNCGAPETRRAIAAAEAALPTWRGQTAKQRAQLLQRWLPSCYRKSRPQPSHPATWSSPKVGSRRA